MAERTLVVDHLKFSYEGLFNPGEVYNVISSWFFEKGWDWHEKMNEEQIMPTGKQITLVLEPWKSTTEYYKLSMRIKIRMVDVKEVEVEHKNNKVRLSHGVIRVYIDGYVWSDRFEKWTSKPFWWFWSIIFEKYFFRRHYEKLETWIKSDVDDLYHKVKNYLNVFKYTYQQ